MGWAIAGGILGLVIMALAWYWLRSWADSHPGGNVDSRIGSRPRGLAGVPEEANPDVKAAPAMEVLAIADLRAKPAGEPEGRPVTATTTDRVE